MTIRGVKESFFDSDKRARVTNEASNLGRRVDAEASSILKKEENNPYTMLNALEVHIPESVKRLLFSNGEADQPQIPLGDWIKTVIAQRSFPKNQDEIEEVERSLSHLYQECSQGYKDQISLINIFEQDDPCLMQLNELADQTRSNIGFNLLTRLAAHLSEQDRTEGVIAAVSNNLPFVVLAFLSSVDCDVDLKKRSFVWAIENGHQELFDFLFPQMPINNSDRSELAVIAARSNQVEILEDILSSGKISERVRHQLIEEASSIGADLVVNALRKSQSNLLS